MEIVNAHRHLLKRVNLEVSSLGFGTWGIGGPTTASDAYGFRDNTVSRQALRKAFELGINFFDTSCSYGIAEELLGDTLRNFRDNIVIATKAGYTSQYQKGGVNQDFSPIAIETSIFHSLERLKTDYIDILQLHDCPLGSIATNPRLFDTLQTLKGRGVIRAIGFAGKSSTDTLAALDLFDFDVVQVGISLVDMRPLVEGLLTTCARRGISVIARSPLAFGFLAEDSQTLGERDHRNRFSQAQRDKWSKAKELYEPVFSLANGMRWHQKAINFCRTLPEVSVVNVGMNTPAQVEDNVRSLNFELLSSVQVHEAVDVYRRHYHGQPIERV
jgi:aryl-alcohol dehydrogenase-like predicted oxidoreductase